uniref:Uncharacterized protein n=1 Tax=Tanacetum cinerariifolium TaxID=118510 RepID=A0A699HDW7_TANCI|nr:hypothetical protein [Tanacetum cinerariifolium]
MTRSSKELITPFENPERVFRSKRRLFETPSLVESSLLEFNLFFRHRRTFRRRRNYRSYDKNNGKYMSKTRGNYGLGVARPKINYNAHFELKGQFLKELRENTFSSSEHKDANEYIKKVLEMVDLFHILEMTQDQIMLRAFPMSLTEDVNRWPRTNHQLEQGSSIEEAENESNVWDDGSEDVNLFGGGNLSFQEEPIMLVEEESCPVYDNDNEEEKSMPVYDIDIKDVIEEEEGLVGKGGIYGE